MVSTNETGSSSAGFKVFFFGSASSSSLSTPSKASTKLKVLTESYEEDGVELSLVFVQLKSKNREEMAKRALGKNDVFSYASLPGIGGKGSRMWEQIWCVKNRYLWRRLSFLLFF